jgi:hypothetical protein
MTFDKWLLLIGGPKYLPPSHPGTWAVDGGWSYTTFITQLWMNHNRSSSQLDNQFFFKPSSHYPVYQGAFLFLLLSLVWGGGGGGGFYF